MTQAGTLARLIDSFDSPEGARPTLLEGVTLLRTSQSYDPVPILYEPCIVVVGQGEKRLHLPNQTLSYDASRYLVLSVPMPGECETRVSAEGPFLGVAVRIDLAILGEILLALEGTSNSSGAEVRPVTTTLTDELSDATNRLLQSLKSPADALILGPQMKREFLYRVLQGPAGPSLRELVQNNRVRAEVHRILQRMHSDCASEIGISPSALHHHFKAVTNTSPLQYLQTLRLHRARMLMIQDSITTALAAEKVGYASTSQFSREFKRLFGAPPAIEATRTRQAFGMAAGT